MGKYLKKFELTSQYEEYINSTMALLPNVSLTKDDNMTHYNPVSSYNYEDQYFTIENINSYDGTLQINIDDNYHTSIENLSYNIDNSGWNDISSDSNITVTVPAGKTIQFKCNFIGTINASSRLALQIYDNIDFNYNVYGNIMSLIEGDNFKYASKDLTEYGEYTFGAFFEYDTYLISAKNLILPATTLADWCYNNMFQGCTSLTTAPELPATILAYGCYHRMFNGCTSLTTAPELPATILAKGCYEGMFNGCISLTTAPELPATTLAESCYYFMFWNCSKLNYIKMLATDISATDCLMDWVKGVANTGTFVKHQDMTSLPIGSNGIPEGWIVVNTFNNISPCIINQVSESITFVYNDGLFTPTNEIIDLSQYFTKEELLSVQPECEIIVTLQDKTDNILASEYIWTNDKTLGDVLNELYITEDIYDINIIITKVNAPEDNGYYYYYTLDETEPFVQKDWMRIVSLEDDNTISLSKDIQYSVNGANWNELSAYNEITVNSDDIVYFKGTNTGNHFSVNKAFNVEGNIMSLLYGNNFEGQIDLNDENYAFSELFFNCTTLKNAENLILPAMTLTNGCYNNMFNGCASLTTAPELPATTLANSCYSGMFKDCTSLTTAPELPATTLANSCYYRMFYGCTSLTTATELPATTLVENCYGSMFANCTSLTTAPELPATTLANYCYSNMFNGCSSLTTAPELPATTLAYACYNSMFYGCTSLTTPPELPATTLAVQCYIYMFQGCTKLNYITMLATDISATNCLYSWVDGVASTGTFVKHPDMTSLETGWSGIPKGWTVEDAA